MSAPWSGNLRSPLYGGVVLPTLGNPAHATVRTNHRSIAGSPVSGCTGSFSLWRGVTAVVSGRLMRNPPGDIYALQCPISGEELATRGLYQWSMTVTISTSDGKSYKCFETGDFSLP